MSRALSVDVVVNNHNYGRYVDAAIESALRQSHRAVRVIVVDDGSTDDSRERIAGYRERVTPLFQPNGGQASALNTGFSESRGDVVIFLDADDVLCDDTAARVAAAFTANPELAKVQYRLSVIDVDGKPTGAVKPPPHVDMPSGDARRWELMFPFDLPWVATSGNAFPRWVLEKLMPAPEDEFARSVDWYLKHLATLLGPVLSLDTAGGGYRVHDGNRYEPGGPRLDLEHIRETVRYAGTTAEHLVRMADTIGLDRPSQMLSVADVANRMISRRLEPDRHPIPSDAVPRLVLQGWRAAARREDVSVLTRLMFATWFAAMAAAPRPIACGLAIRFLFPERRARLNRILGVLASGRHPR